MTDVPLDPDARDDLMTETLIYLRSIEHSGSRLSVTLGPATIWLIVAGLQLASRHPEVSDSIRADWRTMGDYLTTYLDRRTRALLALGWHHGASQAR